MRRPLTQQAAQTWWATICLGLLALSPSGLAQIGNSAFHSKTGQFTVAELDSPPGHVQDPTLGLGSEFATMEPRRVALLMERVTDEFYTTLETPRPKGIPVSVAIDPARTPDEGVQGQATRFRNGWRLGLILPKRLERRKLVHATVDLVLQSRRLQAEGPHRDPPPTWLSRGLAEYIVASTTRPFYPEVDVTLTSGVAAPSSNPMGARLVPSQRFDPTEHARNILAGREALTFGALAFPQVDFEDPIIAERFDASAMLLVHSLLKLEAGPKKLARLIDLLNRYRNWQLAFQEVYQEEFSTALEIEKWWTLESFRYQNRAAFDVLRFQATTERLEQALTFAAITSPPTEESASAESTPNASPSVAVWTAQDVIQNASLPEQLYLFSETRRLLLNIAGQAAEGTVEILDAYVYLVEDYLETLQMTAKSKLSVPKWNTEKRRIVERLDELDEERSNLNPRDALSEATSEEPAPLAE